MCSLYERATYIMFYLVPFLVFSLWDILLAEKVKIFSFKKIEKLLPGKCLRVLTPLWKTIKQRWEKAWKTCSSPC